MQFSKHLKTQILWRSLAMGITFLVNVLFARILGAAATGDILYAFAVFSMVILVVSFSMESGVAYLAARNKLPADKLIAFSMLWSIVASLVVLFALLVYERYGDMEFPLFYLYAFVLGNLLYSFGNAFCYAQYKFVLPGLVTVTSGLLVFIALLIHHKFPALSIDVTGLYFIFYLLQGVLMFAFLFVQKPRPGLLIHLKLNDVVPIAKYSAQAFAANIIFLLLTRIDYVFVEYWCDAPEMGNYAQASRIGQLLFVLPAMVSTVIFPYTAAGDLHSASNATKKSAVVLSTTAAIACMVMAGIGWWLFPWTFGDSFSGMYKPFLFLIPGIIAVSALHPISAYHAARDRIRVNIFGGLIGLAIIIPADIFIIPLYGIAGAAGVSSIGYVAYTAYVARKFLEVNRT